MRPSTSRQLPHCPNCRQGKNHKGEPVGYTMDCSERNWHGTGGDLYSCDNCGRSYFITYKVDEITYAGKEWDVGTWEEREAERLQYKQNELNKKLRAARELIAQHASQEQPQESKR